MKNSETSIWIGLAGLFITIIGTTAVLAFKIGVVNEKVVSMEQKLEDLPAMKTDITEIKVKLDVLWRDHLSTQGASIGLTDASLIATISCEE